MLQRPLNSVFAVTSNLLKDKEMKCICCNKSLSDFEATRRHGLTNDFLDMCNGCLRSVQEVAYITTSNNHTEDSGIDEELDSQEEQVYDNYNDIED